MYLTITVSELPVVFALKGDQKIYVRVDGPLGSIEDLLPSMEMDQILREFFSEALKNLRSSQQQALVPVPPDDATSTSG